MDSIYRYYFEKFDTNLSLEHAPVHKGPVRHYAKVVVTGTPAPKPKAVKTHKKK
jgi:hypothetical protein